MADENILMNANRQKIEPLFGTFKLIIRKLRLKQVCSNHIEFANKRQNLMLPMPKDYIVNYIYVYYIILAYAMFMSVLRSLNYCRNRIHTINSHGFYHLEADRLNHGIEEDRFLFYFLPPDHFFRQSLPTKILSADSSKRLLHHGGGITWRTGCVDGIVGLRLYKSEPSSVGTS